MMLLCRIGCVLTILFMMMGAISLGECLFLIGVLLAPELSLRYRDFKYCQFIEEEYYFLKYLIEQKKTAKEDEIPSIDFNIFIYAGRIIMLEEELIDSPNIMPEQREKLKKILEEVQKLLETVEL